jgi:hypothetical protein
MKALAHAMTRAEGVTADTNRLLDAIAPHDRSGVFAEVRAARTGDWFPGPEL